ncbi:hypothetical protein [Psychroserpens sp. MEBiC05023]
MNNKLTYILICVLSITLSSCGPNRHFIKNDNGKSIDKRLVGQWKGNESGNIIEGMTSEWTMIRNVDGTFSLDVKATLDNEIIEGTELGIWWIEDGLFHEFHNDSGKTDIYYYEIISKTQIKFKAKKMSFEVFNEDYEFIDTKISK